MDSQVPPPQQQAPSQAPQVPPPQQQAPSQALPQAPSLPPLLPPPLAPQPPPQQQAPQQPNFVAVPFNYPKVDSYCSEVVKDENTCEGRENFFVNTHTHNIFFILFFYRFSKIRAKKHIFPSKFMLL